MHLYIRFGKNATVIIPNKMEDEFAGSILFHSLFMSETKNISLTHFFLKIKIFNKRLNCFSFQYIKISNIIPIVNPYFCDNHFNVWFFCLAKSQTYIDCYWRVRIKGNASIDCTIKRWVLHQFCSDHKQTRKAGLLQLFSDMSVGNTSWQAQVLLGWQQIWFTSLWEGTRLNNLGRPGAKLDNYWKWKNFDPRSNGS